MNVMDYLFETGHKAKAGELKLEEDPRRVQSQIMSRQQSLSQIENAVSVNNPEEQYMAFLKQKKKALEKQKNRLTPSVRLKQSIHLRELAVVKNESKKSLRLKPEDGRLSLPKIHKSTSFSKDSLKNFITNGDASGVLLPYS